MTAQIPPAWVLRHPHRPFVALHVPLAAQVPVYIGMGMEGPPRNPVLAGLGVLAALALQLRHSLAASRGARPAGWPWTLAALLLLANLPLWWLATQWEAVTVFALASIVMLLRGPARAVAAVAQVLHPAALEVAQMLRDGDTVPHALLLAVYPVLGLVVFGGALVAGARLVLLLEELEATRAELAAAAVGEERVRVSRDLHDLLGQSLSAISLKGDLALRLLAKDAGAARAEIESLTGVARDALRDVRAITRDELAVSLRTEIDGAAALLGAAGVDTRLDVAALPPLSGPAHDALAWAIREGTTNLLRHSEATTCAITVARGDGTVRLEIVNDGVRGVGGPGSGLAGVTERARAASGSSSTAVHDGRFRLSVEVPEEGP
ncbi:MULTISPECIES: histidine kinase [unclassified Nonomuraea]|uniref:sensor histidine kinase n=1 Tax=unclassified Nonomuraea TaxID=2593643 RepID=UPI0033DC7D96